MVRSAPTSRSQRSPRLRGQAQGGALGDAVLLDNLWLTANLKEISVHGDWSALTSLVARIERTAQTEPVAEWLAFERARLLSHRDSQLAKAYAELS